MTTDKENRKQASIELDADDLDKVVGGISGFKSTNQSRVPTEEKAKFSDEPKTVTGQEEVKKGA